MVTTVLALVGSRCSRYATAAVHADPPCIATAAGELAREHNAPNYHSSTRSASGGLWSFDSEKLDKVSEPVRGRCRPALGWSTWCRRAVAFGKRKTQKYLAGLYPLLTVDGQSWRRESRHHRCRGRLVIVGAGSLVGASRRGDTRVGGAFVVNPGLTRPPATTTLKTLWPTTAMTNECFTPRGTFKVR